MIDVKGLTKLYSGKAAIQDITFHIDEGRIYGLLGPNGAGKTTTMNIMTGYIAASQGTVVIDGHDIFDEPREAKKCIGYLPELPPLYPDMTTREYLKYAAAVKETPHSGIGSEVSRVMSVTGCDDVSERLIKNLSKGYRQRIGIAQALIGDPRVVILDEPTVGLDPKQIIEIRDLIISLGRSHTVILSSHILQEVSAVCDYVMILSHGRLVAQDTPDNLKKLMSSSNVIKMTVRGDRNTISDVLGAYGSVTLNESPDEGETSLTLEAPEGADVREQIFYALAEKRCPIVAMSIATVSLEDVFLELTEEHEDAPEGGDK